MTVDEIIRAKQQIVEFKKEKIRRLARNGSFIAFIQYTKPDYELNWHHRELIKVLNQFIQKKIKRLMIFCPPRHGKSELVSRRLPAYLHGLYPNAELMVATYNADLAGDMTKDVQRIMDRKEYQEIFPNSKITPEGKVTKYKRTLEEHELLPIQDLNGKLTYLKGKYRAQGIGGSFSGRGADFIIIDDPIKNREDADSKVIREGVWKFYTSTLRSRQEGEGGILLTMTRWHEDDLAGKLLRQAQSNPDADQWVVVKLPAIKEDDEVSKYYIDNRLLGEALWPSKFNEKILNSTRAVNSRDWYALYQQVPTAESGNIFKKEWFKFYNSIPPKFDQMIQSWDFAVKDKSGNDYSVGQVWGRIGTNKYLLYQVRGHWPFPQACEKLLMVSKTYPNAYKKLIEAKANGPAVKQTVDRYVTGIVEVEPRGDKVARAHAVSPELESGHVWFPHQDIAPWINEFINELCAFPNGTNDDQVDAFTQAIDELRKPNAFVNPSAGHGSGIVF